ncbi:MAG: prolipoprotein diacylglyceryl transferase family protein, partial [Gaiellaceae bacterium]
MSLLASIPSPGQSTIEIGRLTIHFYGLMLLLAIAAAMWLTGLRYVRRGGNWDLIFQVAVWGVLAGVVGARLYHDATSWNEVSQIHHWWAPFAVWKGGLGVYGGMAFGV